MRRQELEGDGTLQLRVFSLVDDTHAAFAEFGGDLVVGDGLADHGGPLVAMVQIANGNKAAVELVLRARTRGTRFRWQAKA